MKRNIKNWEKFNEDFYPGKTEIPQESTPLVNEEETELSIVNILQNTSTDKVGDDDFNKFKNYLMEQYLEGKYETVEDIENHLKEIIDGTYGFSVLNMIKKDY